MEVPQNDYRLNNPVLKKDLIGKKVVDSYGTRIGKIIGFSTDSLKNISSFGIERNDGGFMKCDTTEVILDQDLVKINSSWRLKAESLASEVTLTIKKISALHELKNDVEVSKHIYDALQSGFEAEKKTILDRRRNLKDRLKERLSAIHAQLKEVYEFIAYVKISYHIGDIDEETYQRSYIPFQLMIDKLLSEEDDIKFALNIVTTNISMLPPEPLISLPSSEPQLMPIKLRIRTEETL
ncbi:MAG: CdvA-like protein [Candidatus Bathyarchaeota archaeon]|nr:CdvA-like protein [Candidatus Bathyarchaeota archaeon]